MKTYNKYDDSFMYDAILDLNDFETFSAIVDQVSHPAVNVNQAEELFKEFIKKEQFEHRLQFLKEHALLKPFRSYAIGFEKHKERKND